MKNCLEGLTSMQLIVWKDVNMSCGCGRSPTGKCIGWHKLTEEQYLEKKAQYEAKQATKEKQNG